MDPDYLKSAILDKGKIKELEYFDTLESTNDYAKKNSRVDGSLIVCNFQSGGKGRFNRKWVAQKGEDITFTLVRSFVLNIDEMQSVNFYTTYIIYSAVKGIIGEEGAGLQLKWPNDIMLNGKKICGILIEIKDINKAEKRFIIGAGVNVNQESFPDEISDKATSLNIETGVKISREKLLINIINSLYYNEELINNKEKLFELWNKEFNHTGKKIKIRKYVDDEEISVTIKELNTDGGLVVEHEDGKVETYYSGEISLSYSEFKKV